MPYIKVKTNCVYIQTSKDNLHVIKKECILAYHVSGSYNSYVDIYTNIPTLKISIEYSASEAQQCMKDAEVLQSIVSPEVQKTGDLLTLTLDNIVRNN